MHEGHLCGWRISQLEPWEIAQIQQPYGSYTSPSSPLFSINSLSWEIKRDPGGPDLMRTFQYLKSEKKPRTHQTVQPWIVLQRLQRQSDANAVAKIEWCRENKQKRLSVSISGDELKQPTEFHTKTAPPSGEVGLNWRSRQSQIFYLDNRCWIKHTKEKRE